MEHREICQLVTLAASEKEFAKPLKANWIETHMKLTSEELNRLCFHKTLRYHCLLLYSWMSEPTLDFVLVVMCVLCVRENRAEAKTQCKTIYYKWPHGGDVFFWVQLIHTCRGWQMAFWLVFSGFDWIPASTVLFSVEQMSCSASSHQHCGCSFKNTLFLSVGSKWKFGERVRGKRFQNDERSWEGMHSSPGHAKKLHF